MEGEQVSLVHDSPDVVKSKIGQVFSSPDFLAKMKAKGITGNQISEAQRLWGDTINGWDEEETEEERRFPYGNPETSVSLIELQVIYSKQEGQETKSFPADPTRLAEMAVWGIALRDSISEEKLGSIIQGGPIRRGRFFPEQYFKVKLGYSSTGSTASICPRLEITRPDPTKNPQLIELVDETASSFYRDMGLGISRGDQGL